jgi:hypothetical protein
MKVTITSQPHLAIIQVLHLIRETNEVAASYQDADRLQEAQAMEIRNAARLMALEAIEEILSGEQDHLFANLQTT